MESLRSEHPRQACRVWGVLSAAALLLGADGCGKKPLDPSAVTRRFFEQIAAGHEREAYAEASFGFRAQQTEKVFAQTAKEMGLSGKVGLSAQPPEISGREARLKVEVSTVEKKLPFQVTLVEEGGAWRIYSLRNPQASAAGRSENRFSLVGRGASFSNALSTPMPDEKEIRRMVNKAIRSFGEAIEARNFEEFYQTVSDTWRKQLTLTQLSRAFQPFIDNNVKLGGVGDVEMKFDGPPAINTDGLLLVNGHYTTAPYQVYFNLKFVYELPSWKLFGIDVNLQR